MKVTYPAVDLTSRPSVIDESFKRNEMPHWSSDGNGEDPERKTNKSRTR